MSLNETNTTQPNQLELTSDEIRLLGCLFIAICIICLIAYIPVLWIFIARKNFYQSLSYRLMTHIGVIEVIYLTCIIQMSVTIIFNIDFGSFFGKTTLAVRTFTWIILAWLTTILALNRSDAIGEFLDRCINNKKRFFNGLLVVAYGVSLVIFVFYLIPGFRAEVRGLKVIREDYNKLYIIPIIDYMAFVLYGISYLLYVIAFVYLILMRLQISTMKKTIISRHEFNLFIQSLIICGYKSGLIWLWDYYDPPTKFVFILYWCLTIFECGYNPFMYYVFNKTLREEIKKLLNVESMSTIVYVFPTTHAP